VAPRRSEGNLPENEDSNDDGDHDDGDDEEGEPDATCDDMNANDLIALFYSGPPSNHSHSAPSSNASTPAYNLNISTYTQLSAPSTPGSYSNESRVKNKQTKEKRLDATDTFLQLEEQRLELPRKEMNDRTQESSALQFVKVCFCLWNNFLKLKNLK
jgi:hypothetical protein